MTMPPRAAPEARANDHVAEESALAGSVSSAATRLGRIALRAGSKKEEKITSRPSRVYTSPTSERERARSNPRTTKPRAISARIIKRRREKRSTRWPASGVMKNRSEERRVGKECRYRWAADQ